MWLANLDMTVTGSDICQEAGPSPFHLTRFSGPVPAVHQLGVGTRYRKHEVAGVQGLDTNNTF